MDKYIEVTFPNGEKWQISGIAIALDRANHFLHKELLEGKTEEEADKIFDEEYEYTLENSDEMLDWARNNMNWDDVKYRAIKVSPPTPLTDEDRQKAWLNDTTVVVR